MLQKAYNISPIFIQNFLCSVYGYREARKRFGSYFEERLVSLRESQWNSKSDIFDIQSQSLRDLVGHAYNSVPYYKDLFRENKLHPSDITSTHDLHKIPVLTKEDVRHSWKRMVSTDYNKKYYHNHTSGSTGKALDFYLSRETIQFQQAVWWRFRERFGINFGDKSLNFIGKLVVPIGQEGPPYWRYNKAYNQYIVNMQHIKKANVKHFVDFINKQDFKYFSGYPSIIYALAVLIQDSGLKISSSPKAIMTGAEKLYQHQKELIQEVFDSLLVDQYGFSEAAGNASKCENHVFHEDYEFGLLEAGESNSGSENITELIATGFANYAMPFIRYKVGDTVKWGSSKCSCGRESKILLDVEGRSEDYVITPEGTRILRFDYIFKDLKNIKECQVLQEKLGEVTFIIVPRSTFNTQDERKLGKLVSEWISKSIEVKVVLVSEIPRGPSDKFKAVVSRLN